MQQLRTEDDAIRQALRVAGLPTSEGGKLRATRVDGSATSTPFLTCSSSEPVWLVRGDDLRFALTHGLAMNRGLHMHLRATDGVVLHAHLGDARPGSPEQTRHAEEQLEKDAEAFHGFLEEGPQLTLLEALEACHRRGVGDVAGAKGIEAFAVEHSSRRNDRRPVWSIHLRGFVPREPIHRASHQIPDWQRDHLRNVVDARTGEVLFAVNKPHPRRAC